MTDSRGWGPWWRRARRRRAGLLAMIAAGAGLATVADPASAPSRHLGVASCASTLCHGSAKPLEARNVLQNEYVTWSHFDPHGRALRVLSAPEGRAIARRLGLKDAATAPECLACHTAVVPASRRGERFHADDGIGCEACHGGAERWIASHHRDPQTSTAGTSAEATMSKRSLHADSLVRSLVPLERPSTRADICLGCHVGDSRRFATHAMMAAGHPRLAFELDTYTELWRTSGGREHYRIDDDYVARKSSPSILAGWAVGLVAASRRALTLAESRTPAGGFGDFALYNCYSCHRSMRVAAWGEPRDEAPPGMLRLQDGASRALLMLSEALGAPAAIELRAGLRELQLTLGGPAESRAEPMRRVESAHSRLERWALEREWSSGDAARALDALAQGAARGAFPDYAAAEQAAMSMVVLLAQLDADRARAADIERLFAALADDANFDGERVAHALAALGQR